MIEADSAPHLGRLGISPIIIGHVANHVSTTRNTGTTAVYVQHDHLAEKREALTTWDAAMARILRETTLSLVPSNVVVLRS